MLWEFREILADHGQSGLEYGIEHSRYLGDEERLDRFALMSLKEI